MAIPITGAGSLFVRLGHIFGILLDVNAARGSGVTAPDYTPTVLSKVNGNVIPDYAAGTADYPLLAGQPTIRGVTGVNLLSEHGNWQQAQKQFLQKLQALSQATLIDMANADTPQPTLSLQSAMALLVAQLAGNFNVAASSVAVGAQTNGVPAPNATYPSGGNGNSGPVVLVSVKDGKGYQLDNTLAETLTVTTTKDAQSGGAAKWGETYSVAGSADASGGDRLSQLWPSGSGRTLLGQTYVNAALNNSGGNLLQNSEFATFTTANQADNWTYATGSAGTSAGNIGQSNTGFQDSSCLEFFGDGSTLQAVTQAFNTTPTTSVGAGGTSYNILTAPDVPFGFNCWIKVSAVPTAGVMKVDLIDGSGNIINDDSGTANTITVDLTSGGINTTSWHNVQGTFHMPAANPSSTPVKLRIRLSTAIDNGKDLFVDRVAVSLMTQLYGSGTGGGPFVAAYSGNTQTLLNDFWTLALTNTMGSWISLFQRVFGMQELGLRLPTTGGSTISTTLIA